MFGQGFQLETLLKRQHSTENHEVEKKKQDDSFEVLDSGSDKRSEHNLDAEDNKETEKQQQIEMYKQQLGLNADSFDHLSQYDLDD